MDYRDAFCASLKLSAVMSQMVDERRSSPTRPKIWSDSDVDVLVKARCQVTPPSFRNIASELNRHGTVQDRLFTDRDCINKWHRLFPTPEDANRTVQYVSSLKKIWPELVYRVQPAKTTEPNRPPKLVGLHLVWPWCKPIMKTLGSSIFCDATFNVTVYHYKVVCITTLDGNHQHRPLMCSFILESNGDQWAYIFNLFNE